MKMAKNPNRKFYQKKRLWIMGVYLLLLISSGIYRLTLKEKPFPADKKSVEVSAINGDNPTDRKIRFAYREYAPEKAVSNVPLLLIHGSPGDSGDMTRLASALSKDRRVIVPDMPGFGDSTISVPDYSFRAHAHYLVELADQLGIKQFDILGFSMGGGVAVSLYDIAPEKVRSIQMVSALGVQEYELLGDHNLNHGLHGIQYLFFWGLRELIPHFGVFGPEALSYCRNFYDSDQRPLREIMRRTAVPTIIIHGANDPLVPVESARETNRLIPQSEYREFGDESHFMVFARDSKIAPLIGDFLNRVENGQAVTLATADPNRIAWANQPFQNNVTRAMAVTAFVFFLLLAVATLVSEDLTCIAAGALAAQGRIDLSLAIAACFFGIYVGDLLLYWAGRWFGKAALKRIPFRWLISDDSYFRAAHWFEKRGVLAILLSRFTPSLRLPTYLSAGIFGMGRIKFVVVSFLAVAVWTPIMVTLAYWLGNEFFARLFAEGQSIFWKLLLGLFAVYLLFRLALRLSTWRGRRLLIGRIRRWTHWEFWPLNFFYLPVFGYIAWLAIKHRSLTVFTCANPAIEAGGFIGESKAEILDGLAKATENQPYLLRYAFIDNNLEASQKVKTATAFITEHGLNFPVAIKPNVGERGIGAYIIHNETELENHLSETDEDTVIQEFAPGDEFGVFYYRYPNADKGQIFAITEKRFPFVTGDGVSTLEELILGDDRAVCVTKSYFAFNEENLETVIPNNEQYQLIDIGSHSRGTIFYDGGWVKTEELEERMDEICQRFKGFYYGRFDIRTPSIEDFKQGKNFKIIEANGVTSEATSIYDPKYSVFDAYRILFKQWGVAFEIGEQNYANGVKKARLRDLIRLLLDNSYGFGKKKAATKIVVPDTPLQTIGGDS